MENVDQALGKLVQSLVRAPIDSRSWKRAFDKAQNIVRYEKVTSISEKDVIDRFSGIVDKFNIMGHQQLSERLEAYQRELFKPSRTLTSNMKQNTSLKYDMLHLLLSLSSSENQNYTVVPTLNEAEPNDEHKLTWEDIIRDDPLEGDHWKPNLETSSLEEDLSDSEYMDMHSQEYSQQQLQQPPVNGTPALNEPVKFAYPSEMDIDNRADQEGLNMLISQQYWRLDYQLKEDNLTEQSLLRQPCQISKAAEWLHDASNRNNPKAIPEANIMREVLSLYKGHEGILFTKRDNKLVCNEKYTAQHISAGALNGLLREFCATGNLLEELRQHSHTHIHTTDFGKTNQAFAGAINKLFNDFEKTISQIERSTSYITDNASQTISLLKLRNDIEPSLQCFRILHAIIRGAPYKENDPHALSVYLLSSIYDEALTCQSFQQLQTFDVLLDILNQTIKPYSRLIDEWVYNGSLAEDVVGEFFVSRNAEVLVDSPEFWFKGYGMRPFLQNTSLNFKNPLFDKLFLDQVLFSGKAVSLLSKLHKTGILKSQQAYSPFSQAISAALTGGKNQAPNTSQLDNQHKSDESDIFTKTLFPLAGVSQNISSSSIVQHTYDEATTQSYTEKMIKQQLVKSIRSYIDGPYNLSANTLNEMLHNECGLQKQMTLFASIYLMLDNNLMHSFCQTLFEQMDNNDIWFNHRTLNRTFRETCELNGYREAAFTELSYEKDNDTLHADADSKSIASNLESIRFNVEIPWPLNNFIHTDCLMYYSRVQQFLLRLKRAKYVIEKHTLFRDRKTKSDGRAMYFYSLRMKMIWLINSFWRYIMTTILHAETIEFRKRLSVLKDADQIAALHDAYVRRIVDRCLLNDKATAIRKSIVSIFDLAEHIAILFRNHLMVTNIDAEAEPSNTEQFDETLKKIEKSFSRSSDFISTSLTIMGRKANMPWFEALGVSLSCPPESKLI